MCSGSEAGSYLRPIDTCITQLKAQGPSRTCNESKEEEEKGYLALATLEAVACLVPERGQAPGGKFERQGQPHVLRGRRTLLEVC